MNKPKQMNNAQRLLSMIGGTAAQAAEVSMLGWEPRRKAKPVNNPAGSKLARAHSRGNGFTCRHGLPINTKQASRQQQAQKAA